MRVIVKSIRPSGTPEEFVVEMLVDGVERSYQMRVVLPALHSVAPIGGDFLDLFEYTNIPRRVAALVVDVYKTKQVTFPIDLGEG